MTQKKELQQWLARRYADMLRKRYLAGQQEALLEEAYELGRSAIAEGLGVLDMARVHLAARERLLRSDKGGKNRWRISKLAGAFFLQTLMPFEATHRGFRATNAELLKRNRELELEIYRRQRAEKELENLSRKILHVQEQERKHISRELHDEVGQALTAISVTLAAIKHNGAARPGGNSATVAGVQRLLENTMETVHRFARELRPAMLDELGLLPALRAHAKCFAERTGVRVRLSAEGAIEKLNEEQKTAMFRIMQECLTNVAKHARASRVNIVLAPVAGGIGLEIADNGRSFRLAPDGVVRKNQRLGLLGMQERVRLLNGRFDLKPEPGRGTTVRVVIPFPTTRGRSPLTK